MPMSIEKATNAVKMPELAGRSCAKIRLQNELIANVADCSSLFLSS